MPSFIIVGATPKKSILNRVKTKTQSKIDVYMPLVFTKEKTYADFKRNYLSKLFNRSLTFFDRLFRNAVLSL